MSVITTPDQNAAGGKEPARTAKAVVGAILVLSLVTPYFLGALGAYFQILCTLAMAGAMLVARQKPALAGDPGFKLLIVAFVVLSVGFTLGARDGRELPHALDFAMVLFFGPISGFLARFAAPRNTRRVANLALSGAICTTVFALYQILVAKEHRASGWDSGPIWSAEVAVILGFISALGATSQSRWRWLYLAGPVLGVVTCLASGSRGPLLAVPFLIVVIVFISPRRWWAILAGTVLAAAILWIGMVTLLPQALPRLDSILVIGHDLLTGKAITGLSGATRQQFYSASLGAFLHSPWVGYGWTNKMTAIVPYLPGNGAALIAPHHHLHSDILDFIVSGGLVGLLAYGLILAAPIAAAMAGPRDSQFRAPAGRFGTGGRLFRLRADVSAVRL